MQRSDAHPKTMTDETVRILPCSVLVRDGLIGAPRCVRNIPALVSLAQLALTSLEQGQERIIVDIEYLTYKSPEACHA